MTTTGAEAIDLAELDLGDPAHMELAGEPERVKALFLNQHVSIPVRLEP